MQQHLLKQNVYLSAKHISTLRILLDTFYQEARMVVSLHVDP
jgi:hypothetical protein